MTSLELDFDINILLFLFVYLLAILTVVLLSRKLVIRKLSELPERFGKAPTVLFVLLSIVLLIFGYVLDSTLREKEYKEYYDMAKNMGTIFSRDLRNEGHATLYQSDADGSKEYTHILRKITEWQNHIKEVQSVYTMRMDENGQIYFVVAPATDYNKDGRIRGEMEQRVPMGTLYKEEVPELKRALKGTFTMQKKPTTDRWGYSISAFIPVTNGRGEVESVLGIDFDGDQFMERKMNERLKVIGFVGLIFIVVVLIYVLTLLSLAEKILTKKHKNELHKMAYYDELTGLPNRNYLNNLLPLMEWGEESVVAVILFGFEGLDAIDELLGNSKCDNVYVASIRRIQTSMKEHMKLIRWSEREHLIIVKDYSTEQEIVNFAESLVKQFLIPVHVGSRDFYISPKFGISFYPNDGSDWNALVKNANLAKMHVPSENDNRVMIYNSQLLTESNEKRDIELELHHAVIAEQFEVFYQPQLSLISGKPIGMEALLRWNHPSKGIISPLKFIPLAEELKLINQIGLWVLKKACTQTVEINELYGLNLRVSVNLSSVQLQHPHLLQDIKKILIETRLEPRLLDLEITEGSLFNFEKSSQILEDIKNLGIHISLDDFGAGYSSLSYLKKLSIHRLKIDRIFLLNIPKEEDTLMTSIVTLGHNLNLKVLAEGAETIEQVNFLKSIECDEVQGYYFAKPLPYHEFIAYLNKQLNID
ncbi:phosphodiesterase [Robertmurraya korlensis]|uniref:putative bifunctional diguanylate cyclase/phosphodiesterase n=1 Tax=Robertmurraya korlensis TaxID=519977 RepID=UPI00203AC7BE|nr:phosphodiesterase [Robertmurraya korlensis]MCM3600814.1 phosphodiesterase [Robertmurraya korlensis]